MNLIMIFLLMKITDIVPDEDEFEEPNLRVSDSLAVHLLKRPTSIRITDSVHYHV